MIDYYYYHVLMYPMHH